MKRRFSTLALVAAGWLALAAWDTRVITGNAWQSIYQTAQSRTVPEHTHVTDELFDHLDPSGHLRGLFGRGGTATLDVVDLNASYFRVDELLGVAPVGDDPGTDVEERRIPPPGLFAGLPDYSYGLYDWLNKNTTCPAFSDGNYAWRCHEFMGWLGALNSVHFGSQATEMYAHQHRNALALARRAREMREAMTDVEREVYADELREAELLALSYEGYAQHFLQDRWAMGHMWERWDAPDPQQQEASLPAHLAVSALAGVIHGSEAVINDFPFLEYLLTRADSMSSPLAGPGNASIPMHFRHHRNGVDGELIPGVGDERFQDALASTFSLSRYDPTRRNQRMNVQTQMNGLMECGSAGWAEVFHALGPGENGGYGIYDANIDSAAPAFSILDQDDCWNMWATNESMMIGLLGENAGRSLALIAATDFVVPDIGPDVGIGPEGVVVGSRAEFVAYAGRLWLYGRDDPNGTQVARGEMTSFAQSLGSLFGQGEQLNPNTIFGFQEGGAYRLPDYAEPIGLITEGNGGQVAVLAEHDARGRDIETLYGAFTGAQSDYWCEHRDVLEELRAEPTTRNRELCERLAGRMYQGIHPDYDGPHTEERDYSGEPVRSLCQIRDVGVESDARDDRDNPYWLDQGYLPSAPDRQVHQSTFTDFDAVANWCARTPVMELDSDAELRRENVVAILYEDEDELMLNGWDFGDVPGQVTARRAGTATSRALDQIVRWIDTQIVLDVSSHDWAAGEDYLLTVTSGNESSQWDRGASVGAFILRVREPLEIERVELDLGGSGPCLMPIQDFDVVDLTASYNPSLSAEEFGELADEFSADIADVTAYFREQVACMRQLRSERIGVLNDARQLSTNAIRSEQGPFYSIAFTGMNPAIERLSPEPPFDHANVALWQDYYTTYIELLDGTIWYLERTDNILQGWSRALSSDDMLQRGAVGLDELMRRADTPERALEIGFEASQMVVPDNAPAEVRAMIQQAAGFSLQFELDVLSDASLQLIPETLRGLRTWTQTQHALTQSAIPQLLQEQARMRRESDQLLAEAIAAAEGECLTRNDDGCMIIPPEAPDSGDYFVLNNWVSSILDGDVVVAMPILSLLNTNFVTADGHERMLRHWPSDEAYQAALSGPGRAGTEIAAPASGSPK